MKRLAPTLFLLVLVGLGALYIFWSERGPAVSRGAVVLLRAPQNEVRRVVLQPANVILEMQSPDSFQVHDPKTGRSALLDEAAGQALWKQIALVQSNLKVQNPGELRQYGLDKPRASIEVDGRKLELGAAAPFDKSRIYARGGGIIALVSADLLLRSRLPFAQWRERRVMRGAEAAQSFALHGLSNDVDFRRDGAQWQLSAPQYLAQAVRADGAAVEAALSAVSNLRVTRWLDEQGQNPARYGLDGAQIAFQSNGKRLEIGGKTSGGFAARVVENGAKGARAPIFEVPASLVTILSQPVQEWRDARVAVFEIEAVERLEIRSGAQLQVLQRDGISWRAENGESGQKWSAAALDLLDFAHNLRAADFVDDAAPSAAKFGMDSPVLTLKATRKDGAVAFELRFGRVGTKLWAQNRAADAPVSLFDLETSALDATKVARTKIFGPVE